FVPLAPVSDPALVASTIARALGVREAGGPLWGGGDRLPEVLKGYLRDKQLLLVLDNFEQVVPAASLVADLLAECFGLKTLVTSRTLLHAYGERDFPVPPLHMPDPARLPALDSLAGYEAIRFFAERAASVKPAC